MSFTIEGRSTFAAIAPDLGNDSDVEILEVGPRATASTSRHSPERKADSTWVKPIVKFNTVGHLASSSTASIQSRGLQGISFQVDAPEAQLLVDNKLYTMPKATIFPLAKLGVTSFSQAMYELNGQCHPPDLSQPLILKAYRSYIFSQYLDASFRDKMRACRQVGQCCLVPNSRRSLVNSWIGLHPRKQRENTCAILISWSEPTRRRRVLRRLQFRALRRELLLRGKVRNQEFEKPRMLRYPPVRPLK